MAKVRDVKPAAYQAPTINVGGRVRAIVFDMNAMSELENMYGSFENAMVELQKGKINDVRKILWAGLIHEEAILDNITGEAIGYHITAHKVGSWFTDLSMIAEVTQKLGTALTANMPEAPEEVKQPVNVLADPKSNVAKVVPTKEELAQEAKND